MLNRNLSYTEKLGEKFNFEGKCTLFLFDCEQTHSASLVIWFFVKLAITHRFRQLVGRSPHLGITLITWCCAHTSCPRHCWRWLVSGRRRIWRMWRADQWTWWVGELQNNSKVDAKNALKSDNIQNQLIVNRTVFRYLKKDLFYYKINEILYLPV